MIRMPITRARPCWHTIAAFCGDSVRLLLAPMEGLLDDVLRAVLTRFGGYDWAVSEFVRVSDTVLPARYYRRQIPELATGGCTASGVPVRVQLLGSDPGRMQDNARRLVTLGPAGVDLNFGCPAPTVNRHRGGAALLDEPELLFRIAHAVRAAVPLGLPFSAKMRLGIKDAGRAVECAQALAEGGVELLVVHARTRQDGYRPPAHWHWVGRVAESVAVPVVANGEVWTEADWRCCRAESGVADVMLGRGAVADPFLAQRIRSADGSDQQSRDREWALLRLAIADFWQAVQQKVAARHAAGRLKQWLNLLRRTYPQAEALFVALRAQSLVRDIDVVLARHGIGSQAPARLAA